MDQVDKDYELTMLKIAIDMYLDKTIAFTEEGLQLLESNRDRFVWELSTNIYIQSGHKVEFYIARDGVNSWLENKKFQLVQFRCNQKEQARQIAEEKAHLAVENARKIAEEKVRREEQARQIAEENARLAVENARRITEEKLRWEAQAPQREEEARRIAEEKLRQMVEENARIAKNKADIFSKLKGIIVEQLCVEENIVNLDTDINECADTYDALANREYSKSSYYSYSMSPDGLALVQLIMAIEEEFDVEIPDEVAEQIGTVEKTVDYLYNKLSLEIY